MGPKKAAAKAKAKTSKVTKKISKKQSKKEVPQKTQEVAQVQKKSVQQQQKKQKVKKQKRKNFIRKSTYVLKGYSQQSQQFQQNEEVQQQLSNFQTEISQQVVNKVEQQQQQVQQKQEQSSQQQQIPQIQIQQQQQQQQQNQYQYNNDQQQENDLDNGLEDWRDQQKNAAKGELLIQSNGTDMAQIQKTLQVASTQQQAQVQAQVQQKAESIKPQLSQLRDDPDFQKFLEEKQKSQQQQTLSAAQIAINQFKQAGMRTVQPSSNQSTNSASQSQGNAVSSSSGQKVGIKDSQYYKTKFCPNYRSGQCQKGESCTFAHSQTELNGGVPNLFKTKLCINFKKGNCFDSERCPYAHGEQELKPTAITNLKMLNSQVQSTQYGNRLGQNSAMGGVGVGGQKLNTWGTGASGPQFQQTLNKLVGQTSALGGGQAPYKQSSYGSGSSLAGGQQQTGDRFKTSLCKTFSSGATCQHGDKCRYAHGSSELRASSQGTSIQGNNLSPGNTSAYYGAYGQQAATTTAYPYQQQYGSTSTGAYGASTTGNSQGSYAGNYGSGVAGTAGYYQGGSVGYGVSGGYGYDAAAYGGQQQQQQQNYGTGGGAQQLGQYYNYYQQ